jgi:hypothetical protein
MDNNARDVRTSWLPKIRCFAAERKRLEDGARKAGHQFSDFLRVSLGLAPERQPRKPKTRAMPPLVILFSILSAFPLVGCNSNAAGERFTASGPDAGGPDLVAVVPSPELTPDAWTASPDTLAAPDVTPAPDLTPAIDTTPARTPDAWQAPGPDLGADTLAGIDGGRSDAREAGGSADARADADTFCATVGYSIYCQPDTGKPKCAGPDPSWCSVIKGMPERCNSGGELQLDGGRWTTWLVSCPAACLTCVP